MAKPIIIKHKASGLIKKGYYGFSWTYLIFGWFVPVFRGECLAPIFCATNFRLLY